MTARFSENGKYRNVPLVARDMKPQYLWPGFGNGRRLSRQGPLASTQTPTDGHGMEDGKGRDVDVINHPLQKPDAAPLPIQKCITFFLRQIKGLT